MTQTPRDWNLIAMEEDRDFWKCEYEREKARADAAEAREQRLKEEIEYEIEICTLRGSDARAEELKELLSTLYPDTPAPKEGSDGV